MAAPYYIKTNRIYTPLRRWAWLFILLVAVGGLWVPRLGLLLIPVMLALPVYGLLKGKFWCGNICPHGSLFDGLILPVSANKRIPSWAKSKVTITLAFIWFMFMLGQRLLRAAALWGAASFLDKLGLIFVTNYLMVTVVGTLLALLFAPRAWCRFCPMGTFQTLAYRAGKRLGLNRLTDKTVTMANKDICRNCSLCARVCPVQLAPYQGIGTDNRFQHEACIRCGICVASCPAEALIFDKRSC